MDTKETQTKAAASRETAAAMLRFVTSELDENVLVAYVSQDNRTGHLFGRSRGDRWPKKICVLDDAIRYKVQPGYLYDCQLVPMRLKKGYIVTEAVPHQFEAAVSMTYIPRGVYQIQVRFGRKFMMFDPKDGRKPSVNTLEKFIAELRSRIDIKNIEGVVEEVREYADILIRHYKQDGFIYQRRSEVS